ncbi:MAG: stage V sporulation protein AD [Clostridia bacterium]|nr:stage V sporulation protein AD [Clostridia bacterium]
MIASASVVGHEEAIGPLGGCFDTAVEGDDLFGEETWERAESAVLRIALSTALSKALMTDDDIDIVLSGDLVNQCISSAYGLCELKTPYLGLYGACSTAAEGLLISSLLASAYGLRCASATSSHNATAERQFRSPLEYGGQRAPTSQWTVTGSGAFVVSFDFSDALRAASEGDICIPEISEVVAGRIVDAGITDPANMGAAMAPAAADTLIRYFEDGGKDPALIVTGDLGYEGVEILKDIMRAQGKDVSGILTDCGLMIYDRERQDKHSGGSGCGCSAAVLASFFLDKIRGGELSDLLFVGTGALMNTMSLYQGQSIPAVAHLVHARGRKRAEGRI